MPLPWTPEHVLSLAPDEASRKSASGLASPRKWLRRSKQETGAQHVIWGEVQGSESVPYRCQVDLTTPAFKCSCPSHKLPCKHALGLFLLYASQPETFEVDVPPDWVATWLAKRAEQGEPKLSKTEGSTPKTEPKNRRISERDKKIRAGLDDLETWLCDLLRQGLAAAQTQPRAFWETTAARLVDAQAPGLARLVRSMPDLAASGEGWQERVLEQVTRLYLAVEGYRRLETLPEPNQADLRALIGFTRKQEDLLKDPGIEDIWLVMGREVEEETKLKTQRIWLLGQSSGRPALILSFAIAGSAFDTSLSPGTALPAELVFYPGAHPLRAIIRSREPAQALPAGPPGCDSLAAATGEYAAALSAYPWLERYPLAINGVRPLNENGEWALYDAQNRRMPLSKQFLHGWSLLSLSGGRPIGIFGEWNGERLFPLSAWAEGLFVAFRPRLE